MNKRDLIIAAKRGFPIAEDMVNSILLAINIAFINKQSVSVKDFGSFKPYKSKVKKIYNFQTGEWSDFDGTWTIKFKPCKKVKERMNQHG